MRYLAYARSAMPQEDLNYDAMIVDTATAICTHDPSDANGRGFIWDDKTDPNSTLAGTNEIDFIAQQQRNLKDPQWLFVISAPGWMRLRRRSHFGIRSMSRPTSVPATQWNFRLLDIRVGDNFLCRTYSSTPRSKLVVFDLARLAFPWLTAIFCYAGRATRPRL